MMRIAHWRNVALLTVLPAIGHAPEALSTDGAAADTQVAGTPYNARFTFTRIRYGGRGGFRGRSAWSHDYPDADRNMQLILNEFTAVRATDGPSNVFDLEDPEFFRHPIIYMSEPGFWTITEEGAANLREYLLKGGMIIFDDFEAQQWYNFEAQIRRALPEREFIEIDGSHPVFQSFFQVEDIYVPHPLVPVTPKYLAMFENDDPDDRLLVLANYNADLAEYWEFAGRGWFPVDLTNEAYKLGVNYIIFGLTH